MRLMLTNDDSHVSPLLEMAMTWAEGMGDLLVVLPATEQSGSGKSVTCFRRLTLDRFELHGRPVHSIDGTPADCVNIGLSHLCDRPPDVVLSGINIGRNQGIGYILSSGTIGAGLEANLAGIPAVALSQELELESWQYYQATGEIAEKELETLECQTAAVLERLEEEALRTETFSQSPVTWNVNLPARLRPDWRLSFRRTSLATYASRYQRTGNHFEWSPVDGHSDRGPDTYTAAVSEGNVGVARLDHRRLCPEVA